MDQGDGSGPEKGPDAATRQARRRDGHAERMARPRMPDLTDAGSEGHRAVAEAEVSMAPGTLSAVVDGTLAKGDVLGVAELAGVMGGKRAPDLIPLLHPAALTNLFVQATPDRASSAVRIRAEAAANGPAGVEMQALTAASVAALTIFDMIREADPAARIRDLRIVSTSGEAGPPWTRREPSEARSRPRGGRAAGRIMGGRATNPSARPSSHRRNP